MADPKKPRDKTLPLNTSFKDAVKDVSPPSERWESETDLAKTVRMSSSPPPAKSSPPKSSMAKTAQTIPRPAAVPRIAGRGVELFVVDETQLPGGERKAWRAAEVWTKRRVYGLDSTFKCIEILDRETGRPEAGHEMLGARLGGGRLREKDTVRFSYPLPLPGMEAMFMKHKKHGYTSAVERMIVRIRVLHTSPDEATPTWDEIASRWSEPPRAK
jgi:hypothetical protein